MDEEDKERLLRDGYLIEDHREGDEVSIPYNVQVETRLCNPPETGIYQVLTKPGTFEKCYIAINPHGPNGRENFATVVQLEGKKNWLNCHPSHVWVSGGGQTPVVGDDASDLASFLDGLPDPSTIDKGNHRYMMLGPRGDATLPCRVVKTLGDEKGGTTYEVDFDDNCRYEVSQHAFAPHNRYEGLRPMMVGDSRSDGERLHLDGKRGTRIRSNGGDVWIPQGYKLLTVAESARDEQDRKDEEREDRYEYPHRGESKERPIRLGNVLDRELDIVMNPQPGKAEEETDAKKAFVLGNVIDAKRMIFSKTANLSIYSAGAEIEVNLQRMSKLAGLLHLVRDHGLREATAKELIKQAEKAGKKTFRVKYAHWVKRAESPYLRDTQPVSVPFPPPETGGDPFMGSPVPSIYSQEEREIIPSLSGHQTDREVYNPSPDRDRTPMDLAQAAQQAADTGQKEIFDTSTIGQMLKAVRDDTMVDRYIGDLVKGLDRLGRILFMFYWHGDEFTERYGEQDMPELEDALRNAFEQVGDVILFLKQKTVDPYPEEVDLDLGAAASA